MAQTFWKYILASVSRYKSCIWTQLMQSKALSSLLGLPVLLWKGTFLVHCWDKIRGVEKNIEGCVMQHLKCQ